MKVVHLSQTDGGAGAGRAAYRIHSSLLTMGLDSSMIVGEKRTVDDTVGLAADGWLGRWRSRIPAYLEAKYARRLTRNGTGPFSPASFGHFNPATDERVRNADIICLYWINGGFIRPEGLTGLSGPVVWRFSDIWPFSGGCHYPGDCQRFTGSCGACPQLVEQIEEDCSRRLWQRKAYAWRDVDLTLVAPSRWIADLARKSSICSGRRVEVIPTGVDLDRFRPLDRMEARARFGIPQDRLVILFGALDPGGDTRKGFGQLRSALEILRQGPLRERLFAAVLGDVPLQGCALLPVPGIFLGRLGHDDQLASAYSAADVVVVPSLEDNLPNVALEASSCGAPVVAFDTGGLPDIVEHMHNGYLADLSDAYDLANGIQWVLDDAGRRRRLAENARSVAEQKFSLIGQAKAYLRLYEELVAGGAKSR